jgi:dTDP-glucose pyrophosphorylase
MEFRKYAISPTISVRDAIQTVSETGRKVVLVIDQDETLLGIFSDGDMRSYIIRGGDLTAPVEQAMNRHPIVFSSYNEVERVMKTRRMVVYPVVDAHGRLVDAVFWKDEDAVRVPADQTLRGVSVVVMAGGKGTRLYPYTKILPKPLIPIGDFTISERIINSFQKFGCEDFHFILNYKSNMIKAYFNDLDKNYSLSYVDEQEFLGTGGGLSLLKGKIHNTCFVSNCDILVDDNYYCMYKFHKEQKNKITFVCAMKNMTIPYGVISLDSEGVIKEISEKPSFSFLTNTGLYLLEPDVLESIEDNVFIHLPDIARKHIEKGERVGVYPVSERAWLDMGQLHEMENMLTTLGEN